MFTLFWHNNDKLIIIIHIYTLQSHNFKVLQLNVQQKSSSYMNGINIRITNKKEIENTYVHLYYLHNVTLFPSYTTEHTTINIDVI